MVQVTDIDWTADAAKEGIGKNLAAVRERIGEAARRAGRDPASIRIMAVTKTFPRGAVEAAAAEGLALFGENRVAEAEGKYMGLPVARELHLIGHLQRNKAREAASVFQWIQSIDKPETAQALQKACMTAGRTMEILLEVNTSGEESKSGVRSPGELETLLEFVAPLGCLHVRGLMTVGPLTEDEPRIRTAFRSLKSQFDRIRDGRALPGFDTLSMGMSSDYPIAVEEGSTLVRIGTALFGGRHAR
jgi:PLP dependent protein